MAALELTILMPCLNEAETVGICIDKAKGFLKRSGINGEVLIADNGSTDGSREIARAKNARVVDVPLRGYGAALLQGVKNANGHYVIMGDSDDSYDFSHLDPFIAELRKGADLVIGNRFAGGISPGAMPILHRYLGNPVLSFLGRLFFSPEVRDFHCGLRGIQRDSILALNLRSSGMEFASEMVVRSSLAGLKIAEVPTKLSPDGRTRAPHLRTWRDGWRHLRFLLLLSPRWLFIYPGALILIVGILLSLLLFQGPVRILPGVTLDVHSLIIGCMAMLVGTQWITLGIVVRRYATSRGLLPPNEYLERLKDIVTLERLLILAGIIITIGLVGVGHAIAVWAAVDFGPLQYGAMVRVLIISCTFVAIGLQIISAAFLAAVFSIETQ